MSLVHLFVFISSVAGTVQPCPSEDSEPALEMKTAVGPSLQVCGFEDHDVKLPNGARAFADFSVFYTTKSSPQKVFTSEVDETYGVRVNGQRGLEVEELWFFSDRPVAGIRREIFCEGEVCKVSEPKCVYKSKRSPFPKALATFERRLKEGKLKDDGEELIDQIFAQALSGDKNALAFYQQSPAGLPADLAEVYEGNKKKLSLKCP